VFFPDLWKLMVRVVDPMINRGEDSRALRLASWYARLHPKDPQAWIILARVHGNFGREPEAEDALRRGLHRNPGSVELIAGLSERLADQGKVQEAREMLDELRAKYPDSPVAYSCLAYAAHLEGNVEDAKRLAHQAYERIGLPDDLETLTMIATTLVELPGEAQLAEKLFFRAAKWNESDPRTHMALAILLKERDPEAAAFHEAQGRRHWRGPSESFDRYLEVFRRRIGGATEPR
jgi:Flp pilus assembly protein TadD